MASDRVQEPPRKPGIPDEHARQVAANVARELNAPGSTNVVFAAARNCGHTAKTTSASVDANGITFGACSANAKVDTGKAVAEAAPVASIVAPRPQAQAAEQPAKADTPASGNLPVIGVNGMACKTQPRANEVPVLTDSKGTGCEYSSDPKLSGTFKAYQASTARFFLTSPETHVNADGSGVALAAITPENKSTLPQPKDKAQGRLEKAPKVAGNESDQAGTCLIGTADHVAFQSNTDHKPRTINGVNIGLNVYPGRVVFSDPANDFAIVAAKTGADTAAVCHPAKLADGPAKESDEVVVSGHPHDGSVHLVPGIVKARATLNEIDPDYVKRYPQRSPNSPAYDIRMATAAKLSGSGVFKDDALIGLFVAGNDNGKGMAHAISAEQFKANIEKAKEALKGSRNW